jgi:hypothetical protein
MKDLKQYLVDGDPLAREGELDAADAQRIRHRILAEARTQPATTRSAWLRPLVVAGALAACLLLAITIGGRLDSGDARVAPSAPKAAPARQMQFAAPGGTRIIWTFHQELDL